MCQSKFKFFVFLSSKLTFTLLGENWMSNVMKSCKVQNDNLIPLNWLKYFISFQVLHTHTIHDSWTKFNLLVYWTGGGDLLLAKSQLKLSKSNCLIKGQTNTNFI